MVVAMVFAGLAVVSLGVLDLLVAALLVLVVVDCGGTGGLVVIFMLAFGVVVLGLVQVVVLLLVVAMVVMSLVGVVALVVVAVMLAVLERLVAPWSWW